MVKGNVDSRRGGRWLFLLLVGVLAGAGALVPVAAHADPSFKAGFYPATLDASGGQEKFNLEALSVECATTGYHGELEKASTTLTLAPTYSGCKTSFSSATITTNGCKYVLHVAEQTAEDKHKATFDIACEAGKEMTIHSGPCVAHIPAQSGLASVEIVSDREASPKPDITFKPEVSSLSYTATDGMLCPFSGSGAKTGSFTASSPLTLTGQDPGNPETKIGVGVGEPIVGNFFKAGFYPATLDASGGQEKFNLDTHSVECATTGYHGELKEASTTLTLAPTFGECKMVPAELSTTVTINGCKYVLHVAEQTAEDKHKATFDIACEAGKEMTIDAVTCVAHIPAQSGLASVEIVSDREATPKPDITFKPEVSSLSYTATDGFLCPFSGSGAKTGSFTAGSPLTLTGQSPSNPETKIGVEVGEPIVGNFFKAGFYPATLDASGGQEKFTLEPGNVECETTSYHGEVKEASTTLSLTPTYGSCKLVLSEGGSSKATITTNGCKYVLHVAEQTGEDKHKATFDIACEAGKEMTIDSGTCVAHIPAQSGLASVEIVSDREATPKRDITFKPEVSSLSYTATDGFLCPFSGSGAKTGSFTASSPLTLTGQSPSNPETKIGVEVG